MARPNCETPDSAVLGITRFLTDGRGQYIGHRLGRKFGDLDQELRRALHEGGLLAELESVAARVVECLAATGYSGPAGIDALIYRDGATPKLKPIVEINPRYTMGRIAWELDHFVYHAADADWLHLNLKQARGLGHAGFREFVAEGQRLFPPERKDGATGPLIAGFIATNDAEHAELMQTVLAIGPAQLWLRAELAKIQPERP